jgi:hypothetical protein
MSKKPRNPRIAEGSHNFVGNGGTAYGNQGGFPVMRKGKTQRDRAKGKGGKRR